VGLTSPCRTGRRVQRLACCSSLAQLCCPCNARCSGCKYPEAVLTGCCAERSAPERARPEGRFLPSGLCSVKARAFKDPRARASPPPISEMSAIVGIQISFPAIPHTVRAFTLD
jgi:hypothetical protein